MSWHELRWPRDVDADQELAAMRLLATASGSPLLLEAVGSTDAVIHRVAVPVGHAAHVADQLRATFPGLLVTTMASRPVSVVERAIDVRITTKRRPLRTDQIAAVSRSVLTALTSLAPGESLALLWILGTPLRPVAVPSNVEDLDGDSLVKHVALSAIGKRIPVDAEVRNALRLKQSEPGWKAAGRIGVHAKTPARQRQLIRQVLAALRSTEAPGVAFWVRSRSPKAVAEAAIPWRFPLRLNAAEFAGLAAWPAGGGAQLPVIRQRSRLLPPSQSIPATGRVIGTATYPGRERPLAISATDSMRHTWCVGPSGVGKSTLLARMIANDMAAGRAVIVIEPKSDLIRDCLAHVPADRIDDVVVMDPNDLVGAVGLNPLAGDLRNPELVADQLLAVFKGLYGSSFGNRTTDIAAAGLHTLARVPNMSLVALPLLLTDRAFRRRCLAHVDDPIALEPFWAAFENWSEPARNEAVAPLLNKIRPFLLRPQLRTMLGQASPRFAIRDIFTKRRILLVDCSKGTLGSEVSALLAALVLATVWAETLRRSAIPAERRHPVSVYLDEFQEYLRLPTDLGDALAQARGLGVGFTLANQFAHQLDPAMRSAVLANCQNKICFRLSNEDARIIATKGGGIEPEDFASLEAFEMYAQLVANHTVQPWCSAKSLPPDPPISDPDETRAASRARYARRRDDVEREIRARVAGQRDRRADDIGPRRRKIGDSS